MKKQFSVRTFILAGNLLLAAFVNPRAFGQGDLLPPPGPPTPTMKSLDQVEPRTIVNAANTPGDATNSFIISTPGSYYLTGNVTGTSGKHGISIRANDVTLDLNGFALISGGGAEVRGVDVPVAQSGFSISKGSVRGWAGGGVRAENAVTLAEKLRLSDNAGATGLAVGNGSLIKDCVASGNHTGFSAEDRAQLSNCISTLNTIGYSCTNHVTLLDCTASRGSVGIIVQENCKVLRCSATRNTINGIEAGSGSTIADCIAGWNDYNGIGTGIGSTVRNCTTRANGAIGINCGNNCHIVGNTSDANYRGIYAGGNGSRIDGNSCSSNTLHGYSISGNNNLIIRNSAHSNATNYSIYYSIGFNPTGPIVDMTGGNTIPSTNPWANFSH